MNTEQLIAEIQKLKKESLPCRYALNGNVWSSMRSTKNSDTLCLMENHDSFSVFTECGPISQTVTHDSFEAAKQWAQLWLKDFLDA